MMPHMENRVTFQSQKGLLSTQPAQRSLHRSIWPQGLTSQEEASGGANNESENRQKVGQCSHLEKAGLEH